ncbi:receptor kinase-like protein Xa21 [Panicum virgatum]|nr:receptor kinase-like protein Xa21 [Panicum virgatum]
MEVSLGRGSSNATAADELALTDFKSMLLDPTGSLVSWNSSNHYCSWQGVTCSRRHPEKVVAVNLESSGLAGRVSPFLGNLSFLRILNINDNKLLGEIPPELGRLGRLQELNLSLNSLEGGIPSALGKCSKLISLSLKNNHLQGEIPTHFGSLKNLVYLNLYANNLSGEVPPFLGNMSSIQHLDLGENTLRGPIPKTLGGLTGLRYLSLESNNLSGAIPPEIWNVSSLMLLSFVNNALSGIIPPNALSNLPSLQTLFLNQNQFHGSIPTSLGNASKLQYFEVAMNNFSGLVPSEIRSLQSIQWIVLAYNSLEAEQTDDWSFMSALTNCSQLICLELDYNRFSGVLPSSVSNLSTSLQYFSVSHNEISGVIPEGIGNFVGLLTLGLENNYLTGTLPHSLSKLRSLSELSLSNNRLTGHINQAIGNFTQLNYLYLHINSFIGSIPRSLGNLSSLLEIVLSSNNFNGTIPSSIFSISTLFGLDLSHNQLEGTIPHEVGNLQSITILWAQSNRLSGEIPDTLGECQLLQKLQLQNNFFHGSIPFRFSGLKGLVTLDLSSNNLSGQIPIFFENLTTLHYLNLSFNNLAGEVPTAGIFANATAVSVQGNDKLCGGIENMHLPHCSMISSEKKHKFPVVTVILSLGGALVIILLLAYFLFSWCKKRLANCPSASSLQDSPLSAYSQLLKATDGFSTNNLLGTGTFGSVYRGEIEGATGENFVAVKVLNLQIHGALKSFTAECEAMRNLRHRNLVKVITACSSIDFRGNDFKAIVLEFMPNGSLEHWLHSKSNEEGVERHLNLDQRVSILLDVAHALDHLHFHSALPVVHCDIKPSNVLLDADMVAHVGDFGLARILAEGCSSFWPSTSSMGFRGTIGYAPPEYGAGNTVSTYGDIFSYGILVLEMVTGRRPTDSTFEQGLSLRMYAETAVNTRVMDVADAKLAMELKNEPAKSGVPSNRKMVDAVTSLLQLGISCSEEIPSRRMAIKDIIKELYRTKMTLLQGE